VVHSRRTEWIVTNDLLSQDSVHEAQKVRGVRWKIEEFHRETKQLTGIEGCQCRTGRIQRNHIACAMLVWSRLKHLSTGSSTACCTTISSNSSRIPAFRWFLRKSYYGDCSPTRVVLARSRNSAYRKVCPSRSRPARSPAGGARSRQSASL
jgi:hypothetical protein